jgi:hypothetical protein
VEVDEALVDAELVEIPGLGTLTTRGLAGGDLEVLGGQADGALDGEALAAGALNELGADLLERLNLSASQGDSDAVALLLEGSVVVVGDCCFHFSCKTYGLLAKVLLDLLVRHCEWLSRLGKDDCNGNVMTAWSG